MMKQPTLFYLLILMTVSMIACMSKEASKPKPVSDKPVVKDSGRIIQFPKDSATLAFFKTTNSITSNLSAELTAPAHVAAIVTGGSSQSLVLFENPDLAASYTAMLQNLVNIRQKGGIIKQKDAIIQQKQIELARFKDLAEHGAGTGKDVADAQTDLIGAQTDLAVAQNELANEKTAILEHEAKLKLAGFNPSELLKAHSGKVWVICDIPENQVTKIKEGGSCILEYSSYPGETFKGTIEDIADVVDYATRMVKLRIALNNSNNKLRAGMFATVKFGISGNETLSVLKTAIITVQGKDYVFVRKNDSEFERKEITTGPQINDRIVVYGGLQKGEAVVTEGTMQLKGISFGY